MLEILSRSGASAGIKIISDEGVFNRSEKGRNKFVAVAEKMWKVEQRNILRE